MERHGRIKYRGDDSLPPESSRAQESGWSQHLYQVAIVPLTLPSLPDTVNMGVDRAQNNSYQSQSMLPVPDTVNTGVDRAQIDSYQPQSLLSVPDTVASGVDRAQDKSYQFQSLLSVPDTVAQGVDRAHANRVEAACVLVPCMW